MVRHRKAQSATEYLMTYGWAILAITIVGALLYTQVFSQRSCATQGANGFPLVNAATVDNNEFSIDPTTGILKIAIKNSAGKDITVTKVIGPAGTVTLTTPVLVADGATGTVTTPSAVVTTPQTSGKCYSVSATIVYNTSTGIDQRASGTLAGRY